MKILNKYSYDRKVLWFGDGEWAHEPDEVHFEYRGMKCEVLRIVSPDSIDEPMVFGGHLCGYVLIPEHLDVERLDVHGGITFDKKNDEEQRWIGFDCCHFGDILPSSLKHDPFNIRKFLLKRKPTYKNMEFCINECKKLVDQILEIKHE